MKLKIVPINQIYVGDRYRKDLGDISGLVEDMKVNGIIQPLAVVSSTDKEKPYTLLAGERRIHAAEKAEILNIPIRIYDIGMTKYQMRSIELAENFYRKDFKYIEKVNLQREIHELQVKIHGPKVSTSPDAPGHAVSDTATMLGVTQGSVSQDIKLSKFMQDFPEAGWETCKNQSEATKLMSKISTVLIRKEAAKVVEEELGDEESFTKKIMDAYIIGDFFEGVRSIPDGTIDLVEIDPPYAIDLQKIKKQGGPSGSQRPTEGLSSYNEVPAERYDIFLTRTFNECFRVMKPNSWLICWFGPDPWFEVVCTKLWKAGFSTTRLVGIWVKGTGQANRPMELLANSYEMFFYAWKGRPELARPGMTNLFDYHPVPPTQKTHPTERPLDMITDVVTTFAREGSRVLVPYAGSGNTLIAAAANSMIPVGFDLEGSYKESYILKVKELF